jgi:hypothetical protein
VASEKLMGSFVNGKRISSGNTLFMKRVFPVIWFGFLGLFCLVMVGAFASGSEMSRPPLISLLFPVGMAVFGWALMRKLVFDLADEVHDEGDALRVRFGPEEERIAFANIINVDSSVMTNPPRITLTLREPGRFGKSVAFSPSQSFSALCGSPRTRSPWISSSVPTGRVGASARSPGAIWR